ncbi:hypothetical protein LTS18_009670, partial [Coniosporium uncinatum]
AVQQKQIIVTCNYEARRRGLYKLQLIREAKRVCPEVIIVLGEDLTRFRDASKRLYNFLQAFSWSGKVERLGFDEVFMDVTDLIDYNRDLLNPRNSPDSFFCLSKSDPTIGFPFDASYIAGHTYPEPEPNQRCDLATADALTLRLLLGSHLALYLRNQLREQNGYTATVGISTSKLVSKLVGNLHKPDGQTTLLPPYDYTGATGSNVTAFIDSHEIGKIPGIGFKMARAIRQHVLQRPVIYDEGLVTGRTKDTVSVRDVRLYPGISAEALEKVLAGPGSPHGIGSKVFGLIRGVDDTEVGQARQVPRQISIEDSYIRLDTMDEVLKELGMLARSLIKRMHSDLSQEDNEDVGDFADTNTITSNKHWLAHPKTLRLSTRPRPPLNANGTRSRTFQRISRSAPLPSFVYSFTDSFGAIADRLVTEALVPMFRKLHPERSGWNLSLVNIAVTNMAETASDSRVASGRDISKMFRNQSEVLKEWRIVDRDMPPDFRPSNLRSESSEDQTSDLTARSADKLASDTRSGSGDLASYLPSTQDSRISRSHEETWDSDDDMSIDQDASFASCPTCGSSMPAFALT